MASDAGIVGPMAVRRIGADGEEGRREAMMEERVSCRPC